MSTHAAIIQRTPTGGYRGIYVHSDGYRDYTGRILTERYTTEEAVDALIDLGDLSVLHRTPDACIAYSRNYGEALRITQSARPEVIATLLDWHYLYLWEEGEWHSFTSSQWSDHLRDLAEQAEADAGWDPNP